MENLRNFFSENKSLPEDLKETVEKICSTVENLIGHQCNSALWQELQNLLGIEIKVIPQEYEVERNGKAELMIYDETYINKHRESVFDVLFRSLPSFYTCCDSYCGTEYIILPNNFVIFLDESGLDFSENLEKIADRIIDEAKRHEEYAKLCEEEEKKFWSE